VLKLLKLLDAGAEILGVQEMHPTAWIGGEK
jgi:hypothetical protein